MSAVKNYLVKAMESVRKAHESVKNDPTRPLFHLLPPAMWMNDPNGPIFYNNKYHLFYQHNPFKPKWGVMFWGHAESTDLINWTHLPIALAPDRKNGEKFCFSGCCVDDNGTPTIFYTSIKSLIPEIIFGGETWSATSDSSLITWHRSSTNPILNMKMHKGEGVRQIRDPYIWKEGETWHLILGGQLIRPKRGAIFHYTSTDLELWNYEGRLYEGDSKTHEKAWECPNLLRFGNKSVVLISPFDHVQFAIDEGNPGKLNWHTFDHGDYRTFYAPNTMINPENKEEYLLWGWIRGGGSNKLWNGCFSIPRVISLSENQLIVKPSPKLKTLRTNHQHFSSQPAIVDLQNGCGEIMVNFTGNQRLVIDLYTSNEDKYQIIYDPESHLLKMESKEGTIQFPGEETMLHLFIDRSVLELFINYKECFTARFFPDNFHDLKVECRGANIESLDKWDLKPITQNLWE